MWIGIPVLATHVRLSTVLGGLLILALIGGVQRRPVRAAVATVAWLSLYEIVWEMTNVAWQHDSFSYGFWIAAALTGWVVAAWALKVRPDVRVLVAFAVLWLFWQLLGFGYNWPGQTHPVNVRDEVLNVATKTLLAIAYITPEFALRWRLPTVAKVLRRSREAAA